MHHKYQFWIPLIFLFALPISYFLAPNISQYLTIATLLVALISSIISITNNQWYAYKERNLSRATFARSIIFEILGILFAMTLAGLLGRYIVQVATEQISNDLKKLIAGILIGLLAGMGIGMFVRRTWGRLINTSLERQ